MIYTVKVMLFLDEIYSHMYMVLLLAVKWDFQQIAKYSLLYFTARSWYRYIPLLCAGNFSLLCSICHRYCTWNFGIWSLITSEIIFLDHMYIRGHDSCTLYHQHVYWSANSVKQILLDTMNNTNFCKNFTQLCAFRNYT